MPISTAARRTSAPPSHRPHWAKRRTPLMRSRPEEPRRAVSKGGGRHGDRGPPFETGALRPPLGEVCCESAFSETGLWRRRLQAERLADGFVPFLGALRAAA